jgi:hypothetical protein
MWQAIIKALGLVKDFKDAKLCYGKRWWTSKTLWVNGIAFAGIILQWYFGKAVLPAEAQVGIMAILNMLLRFDTDQPLVAKKDDIICNQVTDKVGDTHFIPVIDNNPSGMSSDNV